LNTADADVAQRLRIFTFRSREDIEALERALAERPHERAAQRALAFDVTSLVHGVEATEKVIAASAALFGQGDLVSLDLPILQAATAELEPVVVAKDGLGIVDLLVASGLSVSNSAARRTIAEGGVYVNNTKITDADHTVAEEDLLHGRYLLVRRGKRNLAMIDAA
jgi:tyrosyl-tRNA synthetase